MLLTFKIFTPLLYIFYCLFVKNGYVYEITLNWKFLIPWKEFHLWIHISDILTLLQTGNSIFKIKSYANDCDTIPPLWKFRIIRDRLQVEIQPFQTNNCTHCSNKISNCICLQNKLSFLKHLFFIFC
jgi:hypothetical protein